jgi:hypothetical protein
MINTMTSLRTGRPRIRPSFSGRVISSLSKASRQALAPTQPPIRSKTGVLSPAKNRSEHEADQSSPFSVEVKKEWIYTSLPSFPFIFTFATHCVLFEVDITQFFGSLCHTVLTSTLREGKTQPFVAVVVDVTDVNVVFFGPLLQVLRLSRPILSRC